jgi:hypothetical protein
VEAPEVGLRFAAEEFANPAHRLVRMFHDQQTPRRCQQPWAALVVGPVEFEEDPVGVCRPRTGRREHGGHNSARREAARQPGHSAGVAGRRSDMLIASLGGGGRSVVRWRGHGVVRACALSRSIIYYACT